MLIWSLNDASRGARWTAWLARSARVGSRSPSPESRRHPMATGTAKGDTRGRIPPWPWPPHCPARSRHDISRRREDPEDRQAQDLLSGLWRRGHTADGVRARLAGALYQLAASADRELRPEIGRAHV